MSGTTKNPERVAAGLKATIHNPQVSEEAKTKARERLHDMAAAEAAAGEAQNKHVAAGLKAAIHNPNVSEEAKEKDRERLHEMGIDLDEGTSAKLGKHNVGEKEKHHPGAVSHPEGLTAEEKEEHHRIGGYKATLKNPHASQEAKDHAKKVLEEYQAKN